MRVLQFFLLSFKLCGDISGRGGILAISFLYNLSVNRVEAF